MPMFMLKLHTCCAARLLVRMVAPCAAIQTTMVPSRPKATCSIRRAHFACNAAAKHKCLSRKQLQTVAARTESADLPLGVTVPAFQVIERFPASLLCHGLLPHHWCTRKLIFLTCNAAFRAIDWRFNTTTASTGLKRDSYCLYVQSLSIRRSPARSAK